MAEKRIAVLGAGGFAREVAWLIKEINEHLRPCFPQDYYEFAGYIVSDLSKRGEHDSEALGDYSWLEKNPLDCLAIGIGTPGPRLHVAEEIRQRFPKIELPRLVHPSLRYDKDSCTIGEGAIICANNVFTVNITIEPFAMVNLSCTIGHEAVIGRGSVLNPTVNISGAVIIGEGVLVGTGAQVLQNLTVGKNAIVGAGSVVNRNVAEGTIVVGAPAKPLAKSVSQK